MPLIFDDGCIDPLRNGMMAGLKVIHLCAERELAVTLGGLLKALNARRASGRNEDDVFDQECGQILQAAFDSAAVH